ncbi:MAG: diaminopimelate epimerase [Bacteroidia bacterium]|jgi:diaminopimelate epimerase|nr:diaminopimelate epimerase [Bacteroidia bacterium]
MVVQFHKFQGTGNDFVMLDNRKGQLQLTEAQLKFLCSRRFGIGADGLILIELEPGADFKMVYYNSNGKPSSMCGNGGRCIVAYANQLGMIQDKTKFIATDGLHEAVLLPDNLVSLKMADVRLVEKHSDYYFLNTGSPHVVKFTDSLEQFPVIEEARKIRYNDRFTEAGTNVNFIQKHNDALFVRTYERGVEDETYSCGTGVTAAALVASLEGLATSKNYCDIATLGGKLKVSFEKVLDQNFYNIWLTGPAEFVFRGEIELPKLID